MPRPTRLPLGDVVQFLEDTPTELAELALQLRDFVLATVPQATETIHWKSLSYHDASRGGRVKGAICQIAVRDDRVRLAFIHGARLPDAASILSGEAKEKRYVEIESLYSTERPPLAALIRSAAEFVEALSS